MQLDPDFLRRAPLLRAGAVLPLPLARGGYSDFVLEDSGTMHPALAARYPGIVSLRGRDAAGRRVRVDITHRGLRAAIFADDGVSLVEPEGAGAERHVAYARRDYTGARARFVCETAAAEATHASKREPAAKTTTGAVRRRYRLAVATTGEYAARVSQPAAANVEDTLAAVVASINRVNEVYESDLAVQLQLIANNDALLFLDPATDPYTNNSGGAMLGENQTTLTQRIGSAAYDIGHVFSTGGGGIANLDVPCVASMKARGVTGQPNPLGDPFDIDYVAHEIGHQFGANHTFNGNAGNCGSNRAGGSAYEPGSGSTIMAYAGICGAQNLQPNSDPYFHARSLAEIQSAFGNDSCEVETVQANAAPQIAPLAGHVIPAGTPFVLTAAASDPDGDALEYAWEQYTLGTTQTTTAPIDNGARPLLRSFTPSPDPARTFPRLATLLGAPALPGEVLPQQDWGADALRFRVTVRDRAVGAGATQSADVALTVRDTGAPFAVTTPDAASTWACGETRSVQWDVAGTDLAPIGCSAVRIDLSSDGGVDFAHALAAAVPNSGSASVTVPLAPTGAARLRVACVDNVFFNINAGDFTLTAGTALDAQDDVVGDLVEDDASRLFDLAALLANDSDPQAEVLTLSNPVGGVATREGGAIRFTPAPDFNGAAGFSYALGSDCSSDEARVSFQVLPVNDAPWLAPVSDVTSPADTTTPQHVPGFASVQDFGAPDESAQQVQEYLTHVVADPDGVLAALDVDASGTLAYTLSGARGSAQVELRVRDDGGVANGGVDTSAARSFTLTALAPPVDVQATLDNGVDALVSGAEVVYVAEFHNGSAVDAAGLQIRVSFPPGLADVAWTCTASGTVCGIQAGLGDLARTTDLPAGASLRHVFRARVVASAGTSIEVEAEALPAAGIVDANNADNAASDVDPVLASGGFQDGFEPR